MGGKAILDWMHVIVFGMKGAYLKTTKATIVPVYKGKGNKMSGTVVIEELIC